MQLTVEIVRGPGDLHTFQMVVVRLLCDVQVRKWDKKAEQRGNDPGAMIAILALRLTRPAGQPRAG